MIRRKTPFTTPINNVFGDVYICQFPFTSGAPGKTRPALVLFDLQQDAIICRVTSIISSGPLDIVIHDWQSAGLLKPSVARLDRIVTAEKSILHRQIGVLSSGDMAAVRTLWNTAMRL
jgi:mRNA-degrading endonuclease toxin of MazEF toxin-antitoxin module